MWCWQDNQTLGPWRWSSASDWLAEFHVVFVQARKIGFAKAPSPMDTLDQFDPWLGRFAVLVWQQPALTRKSRFGNDKIKNSSCKPHSKVTRTKWKTSPFLEVVSTWPRVVEIKACGSGNVSETPSIDFSMRSVRFRSREIDNEEENDFACAAVLTTHTQDVKHLKWHPQKDVSLSHTSSALMLQSDFSLV